MTDATERFLAALRDRGQKIKGDGRDRWRAQCPAHQGTDLNLSVAKGDQGVLLRDWSHGCSEADIARSVGLELRDLFDKDGRAVYDYGDGYKIERRRTDKGKIVRPIAAGITPDVRPLWTPADSKPIAESPVVMLCEGEKTADALVRLGAPCVATWAGGTNGVDKADYGPLTGRTVIIIPDNDEPGQKALAVLAGLLAPIASEVKVWRVPSRLNDAADLWLEGGSLDDLAADDEKGMQNLQTLGGAQSPDLDERVLAEVDRLRVREEARKLYERQNAEPVDLPALARLDQFLAEPDAETPYRIADVWPLGGNVVLAAQYKAGKTTLVGNSLRCLVDGGRFLNQFEVVEKAGRVVLIDDELDPRTLRRWLREQGIQNAQRIDVLPLRGNVSSFDLLDERSRRAWAEQIGPCDVLILDCLRPVLDALGLDENRDAGRFLVQFDALKAAVGASEALLVHHMGHSAERSRGDSRILDWPDTTWKLVRENEDPSSPRFFSAFGRDVNVYEGNLSYDERTRSLTYGEGSRKESRASASIAELSPAVLGFVRANPGCSGKQLEDGVPAGRQTVRATRDALISEGLIVAAPRGGRGGGSAYHPVTSPTSPEPRPGEERTSPTSLYRRGSRFGSESDEHRQPGGGEQ